MASFSDRTVVVTGAGAGIGRGLTEALLQEGAKIGAIDRNPDTLAELSQEYPKQQLVTVVADVTNVRSMNEAIATIEHRLRPVDVLVANAGIFRETSAQDFHVETFSEEIRVNLLGVANSFSAVLPSMLARKFGHLVAISSIASYRGVPLLAGYCASKAGVNSLCDSFRVELKPHGICVSTICPGYIQTDIAAHVEIPDPPTMLTVDEAVAHFLWAIRRKKTFYTFPATNAWFVRMLRYLPTKLSDWLLGRLHAKFLADRERTVNSSQSSPATS